MGETVAQQLVKKFHSIDTLAAQTEEMLLENEGIGPVVAKSIAHWFSNPEHQKLLARLKASGLKWEEEVAAVGPQPLAGQTAVITGGFEAFGRDELKEKLEKLGAKVSSSVSKKTSFVCVGTDAGSKLDKAKELGIKTLEEADVLTLLSEHGG